MPSALPEKSLYKQTLNLGLDAPIYSHSTINDLGRPWSLRIFTVFSTLLGNT